MKRSSRAEVIDDLRRRYPLRMRRIDRDLAWLSRQDPDWVRISHPVRVHQIVVDDRWLRRKINRRLRH